MRTLYLFLLLPFSATLYAQEAAIPSNLNEKIAGEFSTLVNSEEYDTKNIIAVTADGTKSFKSLRDLESELKEGMSYYKRDKFEKAYPILAELSQWGLKSAQSLLGTMYIKGQYVQPSTGRGLAWLGVANELGGEKSSKDNFNYIYEQLNGDQKKIIDQKVQDYIAKFGAEAQSINCKRRRELGSNIFVKSCQRTPGSESILHPID